MTPETKVSLHALTPPYICIVYSILLLRMILRNSRALSKVVDVHIEDREGGREGGGERRELGREAGRDLQVGVLCFMDV